MNISPPLLKCHVTGSNPSPSPAEEGWSRLSLKRGGACRGGFTRSSRLPHDVVGVIIVVDVVIVVAVVGVVGVVGVLGVLRVVSVVSVVWVVWVVWVCPEPEGNLNTMHLCNLFQSVQISGKIFSPDHGANPGTLEPWNLEPGTWNLELWNPPTLRSGSPLVTILSGFTICSDLNPGTLELWNIFFNPHAFNE